MKPSKNIISEVYGRRNPIIKGDKRSNVFLHLQINLVKPPLKVQINLDKFFIFVQSFHKKVSLVLTSYNLQKYWVFSSSLSIFKLIKKNNLEVK